MFDPREKKLPVPGMKLPGAGVAPIARQHIAPVTPHVMPVPGAKHVGPNPGRWDRLQQYLEKPAAPIAAVPGEEKEPV